MSEKEYRDRQKTEVDVIQSIYWAAGEFEDLRLTDASQTPRPPEIALRLQSATDDGQARSAVKLRLKMPARYPDSPPDIQLQEPQHLSDAQLAQLKVELERVAREKLGSEMVLELTSHCQELLDSPSRSWPAIGHRTHRSPSRSPHPEENHERLEIEETLPRSEEQRSSGTAGSEQTDPPTDVLEEPFVPSHHLAHNFKFLKHLGSGAFGKVRKVQNKLDGKVYAVKIIVLDPGRPQDHKQTFTEAQYLARLQHKNIVQYYTSWIEPEAIGKDEDEDSASEDEISEEEKVSQLEVCGENDTSDNITFWSLPRLRTGLCLCIQMEYCENSTLLMALPRLHQNKQRLVRLFREIVEGLSHVHGHRLIHHDLKPGNIFLDRNDHVKIGDFGLAIFKKPRKLQAVEVAADRAPVEVTGVLPGSSDKSCTPCSPNVVPSEDGITCPMYPVGTVFYWAPELGSELAPGAGRRVYTEKVDIYSLGVIWFEMCCGTFNTVSERGHHLRQLREPEMRVDSDVLQRLTDQQHELLRWLLQHDPQKRPSCEELLSSDLVPSPPLEETRRREMVEACFSQRPSEEDYAFDDAFDVYLNGCDVAPKLAALAAVARHRLEQLFQQHGAVPLAAPLLSVSNTSPAETAVRLMTGTGTLVELPRSQRLSLARLLARAGVTQLRYYAIARVYEERLLRGQLPRERQEALFGWHAAPGSALLADAELLVLLSEVMAAFPALASRDHQLVLGHTLLLEAALEAADVPAGRCEAVLELLCRQEHDSSWSQLERDLESLGLSKKCLSQLRLRLDLRGSLERVQQQFTSRRCSEVARQALEELTTVIEYAKELGVACLMVVKPGLVLGGEQRHFRGLVFQLQCRRRRGAGVDVLAEGGRHDPLLSHELTRSQLAPDGVPPPAAGAVSIVFDALAEAVAEEGRDVSLPFEVVVADGGDRETTRRQAGIARRLRAAGVNVFLYCGADSPAAADEAARWAASYGARVLLLPKDSDARMVRVRSLETRRPAERAVLADDLLSHLAKLGVCSRAGAAAARASVRK